MNDTATHNRQVIAYIRQQAHIDRMLGRGPIINSAWNDIRAAAYKRAYHTKPLIWITILDPRPRH